MRCRVVSIYGLFRLVSQELTASEQALLATITNLFQRSESVHFERFILGTDGFEPISLELALWHCMDKPKAKEASCKADYDTGLTAN